MDRLRFKIFLFFYLVYYLLLATISASVFLIFRPFVYIDNRHSYVTCNNDRGKFEIGPNFIYTFRPYLDQYNDKKARKLCGYGIIKDYGNTVNTPEKQNYVFYPVTVQESSWTNAFLVSITTFILGTIIIETLRILIFITALNKDLADNYNSIGLKLVKILNSFIN